MRAVENPCSGILMNFVSFEIIPLGLSSIQKAAPTGSFSESTEVATWLKLLVSIGSAHP